MTEAWRLFTYTIDGGFERGWCYAKFKSHLLWSCDGKGGYDFWKTIQNAVEQIYEPIKFIIKSKNKMEKLLHVFCNAIIKNKSKSLLVLVRVETIMWLLTTGDLEIQSAILPEYQVQQRST